MKKMLFLIGFLLTVIQITGQQIKSFKTSDDETLYYTSKGKGPLVVFLYGGPGIGAAPMIPWADSLSNQYECIIYEQRGGKNLKRMVYLSLLNQYLWSCMPPLY